MGIYSRFKKAPDGFRKLVELLESTPSDRRKKMIDAGMAEDPDYTKLAVRFVMTFDDIREAPDMELAEIIATAPPRVTAFAIKLLDQPTRERFLKNTPSKIYGAVKESLESEVSAREAGGAQLRLIEFARAAERAGKIQVKKIPSSLD